LVSSTLSALDDSRKRRRGSSYHAAGADRRIPHKMLCKFTLCGDISLPFSRHKKPKNLEHLLSYVRVTLTWGVAMQGSSYFHRQAITCLRLSASCTDQNLANRFQAMAQIFIAKAADAKVDDEDECPPLSEHAQGRRAGRA
jgi:hypothetical protein